jgi:cytochrome c oxidase subunit 3/cytochrome o ubiquinol oxidase subunit 3
MFTIFVVAYIFYLGKSTTGPQPGDVLHAPVFYTVCLLASSVTVHLALGATQEWPSSVWLK